MSLQDTSKDFTWEEVKKNCFEMDFTEIIRLCRLYVTRLIISRRKINAISFGRSNMPLNYIP